MLRFIIPILLSMHLLANFDSFVQEKMNEEEIPGVAIAVISKDNVEMKCFGTRDGENPITEETLFAIASCSKAFTATLIAQLVDESLLEWDSCVDKFIPEFIWPEITVRDLLAHRTGFPPHDPMWYIAEITRDELMQRLQYLPTEGRIRENFIYNNLMYTVAGCVAEKITGKSWEELVQERIFDPLGMEDSNSSIDEMNRSKNVALPHRYGKAIPFRDVSMVAPASAINSNIRDMVRWVQFQLGDGTPILKPETLSVMHRPQISMAGHPCDGSPYKIGYGLGWFISIHQGRYVIAHGGLIDGMRTEVMLLPEEGIGVVVLANSEKLEAPWQIAMEAINNQLGTKGESDFYSSHKSTPIPQRIEGTNPNFPLNHYVGQYEHPGYGNLQVDLEKEQLVAIFNGVSYPLEHRQEDIFVGDNPFEEYEPFFFQFNIDQNGQVESLEIPFEPSCAPIVFEHQRK